MSVSKIAGLSLFLLLIIIILNTNPINYQGSDGKVYDFRYNCYSSYLYHDKTGQQVIDTDGGAVTCKVIKE